jgi:Flp pilus assembly protein TadG
MTKEKFWPSLSLLRKFLKDEGGTILVQFTIYLVAIVGMIGLALDVARLFIVNNNLQELADASALAAAAQLDGASDAITRADCAARTLTTTTSCSNPTVPNTPTRWFDGTAGTAILSTTNGVQFYQQTNGTIGDATTDPKLAVYVQVTTGSDWHVTSGFLSGAMAILGITAASNSTYATAWAQGNGAGGVSNCGVVQSFLCNPFESTETNPGNANNFAQNVSVGTMIKLVNGAGAAGNWGLLQVPNENSNPHNLAAFWDETLNNQCSNGNSQGTTRTGNVAKFAYEGMNVRFDSPFGSGDDSVSAPIVIDGFKSSGGTGPNGLNGNKCNRLDPGNTWDVTDAGCPNGANCNGIPAVPCFNATSFGGSNRTSAGCGGQTFAQTDVNFSAYDTACGLASTDAAFGSCPLPRDQTFTNNVGNGPNTLDLQAYWKNHHGSTSYPTHSGVGPRYYMYQQEVNGTGITWNTDAVEQHGPVCTNSTVGSLSRRTLYAAIVDCSHWGITGNKPLPTTNLIAQFFMTEPAGQGTTTPSSNGMLHVEYEGCFTNDPAADPGNNCVRGSSNAPPGIVNPGLFRNVQLVR